MESKDWTMLVLRAVLEGELDGHPLVGALRRRWWWSARVAAITAASLALSCAHPSPAAAPEPSTWLLTGEVVPGKPFPGQSLAPCAAWETTLNGGCWGELAVRPGPDGCPAGLYQHDGKCYLPLKKAPPLPRSATP